ncbi:MAG: transcription antitermination factor NusB [Candidatus Latescibacteria bacterium]|nr:transcription antitermination factor NusB [Candidatus Latescibacterota bacterium]
MATRRMAREVALKALYAAESSGELDPGLMERLASEEKLSDRLLDFARTLCRTAWENRAQYDDLIAGKAEHWALHRIARMDRIILKMALTEFFVFKDVPQKVILDEAIELARQYSTDKSPAFVNGVLDALIIAMEGEEEGAKGCVSPSPSLPISPSGGK